MITNLDIFALLPANEQEELLLGEKRYNEASKNNTITIPKEELSTFETPVIRAIFRYLMTDLDVDISIPFILASLQNTFAVLQEREPLPEREPKTEEQLRAEFRAILERAGYTPPAE